MNTDLTNTVSAADKKAQYDEHAKHLLSQKIILAHILVNTIDEFKGMKPEDVVSYIEGEPYIGVVPAEPGLTNISNPSDNKGDRIVGLNTENSEIDEGMIRFDIIFYIRTKNGLSQIIVNIEIQEDEPTEYIKQINILCKPDGFIPEAKGIFLIQILIILSRYIQYGYVLTPTRIV